ncbi:hypothetical protein MCOR07_000673 [Pyricularia oryzae]|uniref:Uncharacterized protein n=1 Tax=Pyricularia grisea TaxID=148305 RepID=A0ABQ8NL15_PYRGI|nr:hypothetical protein MCOR19_010253 [Pyricularia oryzae]KAI6298687.1 hypothetical protein MCOR33_005216 [Pyricularia grisea]KAI6284881.1 hypothetical protein MCOR26_001777 [Pyricularia oryzae]KAI6305175.1 hypothetical protein MCOR29_010614 [Pyricularia oryzae]KAI6345723.1 hypothetical protein MCOR28_003389 [Pyricularia oryzae]
MSNIPHPGLFPESSGPPPPSHNFSLYFLSLAAFVPASISIALLYRAAYHEDDNNPIPLLFALMIALGATLISWMVGNMVDANLSAGAMQVKKKRKIQQIPRVGVAVCRLGKFCC